MTPLSSIALARAKEQADRVTGECITRRERDPWAPATLTAVPVASWKGKPCCACHERPAEKRAMCHRCYMRARRIAA